MIRRNKPRRRAQRSKRAWPQTVSDEQLMKQLGEALHEEAERVEPAQGLAEIKGKIAKHQGKPKRKFGFRGKGTRGI